VRILCVTSQERMSKRVSLKFYRDKDSDTIKPLARRPSDSKWMYLRFRHWNLEEGGETALLDGRISGRVVDLN